MGEEVSSPRWFEHNDSREKARFSVGFIRVLIEPCDLRGRKVFPRTLEENGGPRNSAGMNQSLET